MKNIIMLAILLASLCGYAQNNYKGKVVDSNNKPIAQATIQEQANPKKAVTTDNSGDFFITIQGGKPIVVIRHIGYKTTTKKLSINQNIIVLTLNEEHLKEVVVSASREMQERKEVPAAISVITAKDIEETKATGIDELVNNVPGVLMSTSKAASNEQHFMSVRSPIATKSLFLYVEDGLPIRPTAVFNHNALLEMNDVSYNRVEILKGPASSIYGSESIGGSFNFITQQPTRDFSGGLVYQTNDLGLSKYSLELSKYASNKVGFYLGAQYIQRKNGPVAHSNYEKFAVTFKNVNHLSETLNWTTAFTIIDYRSDMSGSISEVNYSDGNYESDQTFTERDALAFRFRSTLDKRWNKKNKTTFNIVFRKNEMNQIPSYRIKQFRDKGKLTGLAKGEINSNAYNSYVGLIQHKIDFNFANSSLIIGASTDFSPQRYKAENIAVTVDAKTGKNTGYSLKAGDYILNYEADILNYASYFQYEINLSADIKLTTALRYDGFAYNYNNLADGIAGPKDSENTYTNVSPKLGVNYNISNNIGLYANYANGFTPPQTSTLYRNSFVGVGGNVFNLKPSNYNNYEIGTYFKIVNTLQADIAVYLLEGKNTLITLRDDNDNFFNANAGKTRSFGVEYGINYKPIEQLTITHNGSFAKHKYINFFDRGVDYSNTDRETAPELMGTSKVVYKPSQIKGALVSITHELVGKYNTSFENQIDNKDGTYNTATYKGHNVLNALVSYNIKNYEIWVKALNVFDELYAARARYNKYRRANSYTIGNPRAFHLGVKYKF